MKCVLKFTAASSMNRIITNSISAEWKNPTLVSCVEKPPSAITEKPWQMASNSDMPAPHSARMQTTDMPA